MSSIIFWDHKLNKAIATARMTPHMPIEINRKADLTTEAIELAESAWLDGLLETDDGILYHIHVNAKW